MAKNQQRSLVDMIPLDDWQAPPVIQAQSLGLAARALSEGPSQGAHFRSGRSLVDAAFAEQPKGQSQLAVGSGVRDLAGRAAASVLGAPVDIASMAMAPFGYSHPAPVLGSEWIGKKMENAGVVSDQRRPIAELVTGLAAPATALPKGLAFAAAISPEGKARLLADLTAGKGSGTYRLGDVTEGQAKALQRLGLPATDSRDVMMTDSLFGHLQDGRIAADRYSPSDVAKFAEQAMSKSSQVELNTAKAYQNPALVNRRLLDGETGKRHDAQMPMKVEDGAMTPATIYPRGLPPRSKKPPEKAGG